MLQSPAVNVSVAGITVPWAVSELATSIRTSPVGRVASVTVKASCPPASVVASPEVREATIAAVSSSVSVRVAAVTAPAPRPLAGVAETVTDLSAASTRLSFAVTVTVPALVVEPAATVSVLALDSVKSPDTAGDTGEAVTVSVVGAADGCESVAVTVATPPFSETDAGFSVIVAPGAASSSVRVSAAPVTAPAPWPFASAAVTVAFRPAVPWWIGSSTAVTSTVSEAAVVAPAAMTMVASVPTV